MTGNVQFDHVKFVYPSRPKLRVLKDFNLIANASQTTALCGPSGSGYIKLSTNFIGIVFLYL
jgi:ATP-binding cassette subfamily B (MDR/TAP) protein 1